MRWSQIYTMGAAPLARPIAVEFSHPNTALDPVYTCVKFQLSIFNSFRDVRGPKFTLGALHP